MSERDVYNACKRLIAIEEKYYYNLVKKFHEDSKLRFKTYMLQKDNTPELIEAVSNVNNNVSQGFNTFNQSISGLESKITGLITQSIQGLESKITGLQDLYSQLNTDLPANTAEAIYVKLKTQYETYSREFEELKTIVSSTSVTAVLERVDELGAILNKYGDELNAYEQATNEKFTQLKDLMGIFKDHNIIENLEKLNEGLENTITKEEYASFVEIKDTVAEYFETFMKVSDDMHLDKNPIDEIIKLKKEVNSNNIGVVELVNICTNMYESTAGLMQKIPKMHNKMFKDNMNQLLEYKKEVDLLVTKFTEKQEDLGLDVKKIAAEIYELVKKLKELGDLVKNNE